MTKCKEVSRKIAGGEYTEASWRERFSIRFHLLLCRFCRRYAAQLQVIGAVARDLNGPQSDDASRLKQLELQILERGRGVRKDHGENQ